MRLPDDDELYEVDQTYLGPPRRYIGEMRYRTIFLFLVIAPLTLVLLRKLGMPITLLSVGLWLLGASYLSMKFADYISAESSAGAWLMTFLHELTAPRVETDESFSGGAGAAFRATTRPHGGWARALRRMGRPLTAKPVSAPAPAPAPKVLEAKVVYTPPAAVNPATTRRAIEATPVSLDKPIVDDQQAAAPQSRWEHAARSAWPGRPQPAPRTPHENPWQGAAPWQARREQPEAAPSEPEAQQPPAPAPAAGPAYPQSVQEYRRTLHDEPSQPTTDDHDTHGGAE